MKRKDVIKAIKKGSVNLEDYVEFMDDEHIVLAACKQDPQHFKFASDTLKDNPRIATVVVKEDPTLLPEAGEVLRSDDHFMWPLLKADLTQLAHLGIALKESPEFQIKLLKTFGPEVITYLEPPLKNDKAFFEYALKTGSPHALKHAPSAMKNDSYLAGLAIRLGGDPSFTGDKLKNNAAFITRLLTESIITETDNLDWFGPEVRADKTFYGKQLKDRPKLYHTAAESIQLSKGFLLKLGAPALSTLFPHLDDRLKEDPTFIELALKVDDQIKNKLSKKMKKTFKIK